MSTVKIFTPQLLTSALSPCIRSFLPPATELSTKLSHRYFVKSSSIQCNDNLKDLRDRALNIRASRVPTSRLAFPASRPWPAVGTPEDAKRLAWQLDTQGRKLMLEQLRSMDGVSEEDTRGPATDEVTSAQLYQLFLFNGLPFIGFGILDNAIMIIAGEYVDLTIGAMLGISTMAAAALGNMVSDVCGIGSAGYVELLVARFGILPLELTSAQSLKRSVRWTVALGRSIGISLGCIIGMLPLLFFDREEKKKPAKEPSQ